MAAPIAIGSRFAAQCSPVISSNYDTCGTITKASISHLNVTQLAALFTPGGLFADLDAWFLHSIEMKACGVQRYGLYDWIMANADRTGMRSAVSGTKVKGSSSLLHPFIMAKQVSVVNKDHWKLVNGVANSAYTGDVLTNGVGTITSGPLTAAQKALGAAGDRVIRVQSRHSIPMEANWFRQRETLHIFTNKGGVSQHGQWKVLAAATDTALTYIDVLITTMNNGSNDAYDGTPGLANTTGVIIPGVNNVNDYESWCINQPTIDPRKRVPFWVQTYRDSRCVDSEYREVYSKLLSTNPAFREFGDLDLAQRNAQDEMNMQKKFVNEFFYNKPISQNQTLTLWESLESITSASGAVLFPSTDANGIGGKIEARRANFVGVREQLIQCNRYYDLAGQALNLKEFFRLNYDIMRARRTLGRTVKDIDWFTNNVFRAQFMTAMVNYYNAEFSGLVRFPVMQGQMNELGHIYDSYQVKFPAGININILSDLYFDDFLDETSADIPSGGDSRGNLLLALDIGKPGPQGGSIYWAQIAANRRTTTTASINELAKIDSTYRCVLEAPTIEQTLISNTGTVVVECPLASAWVEGFSGAVPVHSGETAPINGVYNLY